MNREKHSRQNEIKPTAIPTSKTKKAVKQLSNPIGNPLKSGQT